MSKNRVQIKDIAASQLPDFIREDYPTFVSFVEAYYEFMQQSSVDITSIRDIDTTLEEFLKYFKKELAHNYPSYINNDRFILQHIRDQYLAKGSEASYKLLFRLLFSKDVTMEYPGRNMLRISDGKWKQDTSFFVRVDAGNPEDIVGKVVDVQTSKRVFRDGAVSGEKISKITASIERYNHIEGNIYEIFVDRNFYGEISPGDILKYGSIFQSVIVPITAKIRIQTPGIGFKPGMVFQIKSGKGSPMWIKILQTYDISETEKGAIKTAELIKFGQNYTTDFTVTILPSSAVSSKKKVTTNAASTISYEVIQGVVSQINILSGGYGYTAPPLLVIGGDGLGATARTVIDDNGVVTDVIVETKGSGYTNAFVVVNNAPGDTNGSGATFEAVTGSDYNYKTFDVTSGFSESGYVNYGDYWSSQFVTEGYITPPAVYKNLTGSNLTGTGSGAMFDVSVNANDTYSVSVSKHTAKVATVFGSAALSTTEKKFGTASLSLDGNGDYLYYNANDDFGFGTGDFTVEQQVYLNTTEVDQTLFDFRRANLTKNCPKVYVSSTGRLIYQINGFSVITTPQDTVAADQWNHIALSRVGGITRIFLNGERVGNVWTDGTYYDKTSLTVGANYNQTDFVNGYIDEMRISKGVGRYTTTYTVPSAEFLNDSSTVMLLHFNGEDASTTIDDDIYINGSSYVTGNTVKVLGTALGGLTPANDCTLTLTATSGEVISAVASGVSKPKQISTYYGDSAYVGTTAREFFIDFKDTIADNPALINVYLGAAARYPGYYKTNDGFLNDSMYIQDSYYYQAFSYVIRIDEQLQTYAAAVRSMLHPTGMVMFGEYAINNKIDLSVALEALVKSLGVTLYDSVTPIAEEYDKMYVSFYGQELARTVPYLDFEKYLSDETNAVVDNYVRFVVSKYIQDSVTMQSELSYKLMGKGLAHSVIAGHDIELKTFGKSVNEPYAGIQDTYTRKSVEKSLQNSQAVASNYTSTFTKYTEDTALSSYISEGYVVKDPFEQGGYFLEHYANTRDAQITN